MEFKPLGSTGVMVPEIGLGTWKYTGGDAPLRRGIALGANLVDTAEMYRNEVEVGHQAIAPVRRPLPSVPAGHQSGSVLGSHLRYDQVLKAAEESLRKLTVDQIDLYQVHWPNPLALGFGQPGTHCGDNAGHGRIGGPRGGPLHRGQQLLLAPTQRSPGLDGPLPHRIQPSPVQPQGQANRGAVAPVLPGQLRHHYRLHPVGRRFPRRQIPLAP